MSQPPITLVYPPEALPTLRIRVPASFLPVAGDPSDLITEGGDFILTTEDDRTLTTEG